VPKKIENPLRSGLPSKLYLLAYGKPISGYEMARRIYGEPSRSSKIYGWGLKKLEEKGAISKTEGGYLSSVIPLLDEIEKTLRNKHNIELSDFDKHVVYKILDSPEFRSYVEDANSNIPLDQDIDSAWVIMSTLGMLATGMLISIELVKSVEKKPYKIPEVKTKQEFDKLWDEIKDKRGEMIKLKEEIQKEVIPGLKGYLELFKDMMPSEAKSVEERIKGISQDPTKFTFFTLVPKDLLLKLSKLSPMGELFPSITFILLSWKKLEKLIGGGKSGEPSKS
jgi:hypothetical protein